MPLPANTTLPVVIISHGLGDTLVNFRDLGSHLASYGFAVALPEHIGSNLAQKEARFRGLSNEIFQSREFLDRPLDVTYLLDELARLNPTEYEGQLNLEQVAVIGHSFGGYTAFALAGATVNFEQLTQTCQPEYNYLLDAAKLLECRALELMTDPEIMQQLSVDGVRDRRVQLIMPFAPVSNLFGEQGISRIEIPVVITGGSLDIVAPVVPQQVAAFSWLTTTDKYLYLSENSSHTAGLTRLINRIFHLDFDFGQGVEEGVELNRELNRAIAVAFTKVYLQQDTRYEPFLESAYTEAVSEDPFARHLVRELPDPVKSILNGD
jgi:predicted dienelactone hydrolase